jgi:hypothetical protein
MSPKYLKRQDQNGEAIWIYIDIKITERFSGKLKRLSRIEKDN